MVVISFIPEFLDPLLRGDKQQTTRKQTDRFKVGAMAQIYIEQRRRITDKPIRHMTVAGSGMVYDRGYPLMEGYGHHTTNYYAHFLGKVMVTEVYDVRPTTVTSHELATWALADGFHDSTGLGYTDFELADTWFRARYGTDWQSMMWTVIRWNGWTERYFDPGEP